MKTRTKIFLGGFVAVYLLIASGLNLILGPPGMSGSFLESHKPEYDRYLTIVKDDSYQKYRQRPHLHSSGQMQDFHAIVEGFEALPAYKSEIRRRNLYEVLFDTVNVLSILALALWFGRRVIITFLDSLVYEVRSRIEQARLDRAQAEKRLSEAEDRSATISAERQKRDQAVEERLAVTRGELQELARGGLEMLRQETGERIQNELRRGNDALKRAFVEKAVERVVAECSRGLSEDMQTAFVADFVAQLGREQ